MKANPRFEDLKWINLEPIGSCNLVCPHCSRDAKARVQRPMSRSLYLKLLEQVPQETEVRLFLSGEPFLDDDLAWRVSEATSRGLKTLVHTNGTRVNLPKAERILKAGLTKISVSIDGGNRAEYKEMRAPANIIPARAGLKSLLIAKQSLGADTKIVLQCIRKYPDPLEVNVEVAHLVGEVDEVYVRHPHNWAEMASVEGAKPRDYGPVCSFLWVSMSVQCNGIVVPCCACLNQEAVIADAKTTPLKEIWEQELSKWREAQTARKSLPVCSGCERYGAKGYQV